MDAGVDRARGWWGEMSKFRLVCPGGSQGAVIEIDGKKVEGVRGVKIEVSVDNGTRVTLDLVGYEVDVEVEGEIIEQPRVIDVTGFDSAARHYEQARPRKLDAIGGPECKASVEAR